MRLKFFVMYEVVRLGVCQSFYKNFFFLKIPRKCKRHLKKKIVTF